MMSSSVFFHKIVFKKVTINIANTYILNSDDVF